jgi:ankyrin repeat protein
MDFTLNDITVCIRVAQFLEMYKPITNNENYLNFFSFVSNWDPNDSYSPLMFASVRRNLELIKLLLSVGANPLLQKKNEYNALTYCVTRYESEQLIELNDPAIITRRQQCIQTILERVLDHSRHSCMIDKLHHLTQPITESIVCSDLITFKKLYEILNVPEFELQGMYVLESAVLYNKTPEHFEINRYLIEANKKNLNRVNYRPLSSACDVKIVRLLLENGADVNLRDDADQTALMVNNNDVEIQWELVKMGADIFAEDEYGRTALNHVANRPGSFQSFAQYLIKRYLEQIYFYFRERTSTQIRHDLKALITNELEQGVVNGKHEWCLLEQEQAKTTVKDISFPIKPYHVYALQFLLRNYSANLENFYILPYFISSDFLTKMNRDVLGFIASATNTGDGEADFEVVAEFGEVVSNDESVREQVGEWRRVSVDFMGFLEMLRPGILDMANKLFNPKFVNGDSDQYNSMMNEHLKKFEKLELAAAGEEKVDS